MVPELRSLPAPDGNLATALEGLWWLTSRVDVDDDGRVHVDPFLGADPLGILCFGGRRFAAQFMKRDRTALGGGGGAVAQRAEAENNPAAVEGYDAYFGIFEVDEAAGTITTTLEGSIAPGSVGGSYVRDTRVVGDELLIQLRTTTVDGVPITRTNTFRRVPGLARSST